MKKDKLYTVNKWNKPAFMPNENLFGFAGQMSLGSGNLNNPNVLLGTANFNENSFGNKLYQSLMDSLNSGSATPTFNPNAGHVGVGQQVRNSFKPLQSIKVDWSDPISRKIATSATQGIVDTWNGVANKTLQETGFDGITTPATDSGSSSKGTGLFSKEAWGKGGAGWASTGAAAGALGSIKTGDPRGMWDTLDPVYHLAGGRESDAGNAMSDAGVTLTQAGLSSGQPYLALAGAALKVVGGLTNAAFGIKENKQLKEIADTNINTNSNFFSNASSFDDIKGPASMTNTNIYENGWFTSRADDKNEQYAKDMATAYSWADRSVLNNINNITLDQISNNLRNYSAYGGPLDFGGGALGLMQQNRYFDTIDKRSEAIAGKGQGMQTGFTGGAKTFDFGGLKSSFLDEFGSDPIGAAVRYNQGLENLAAQEEAKQIETAKEQEYLGLQQRLADLETQNQGLQALMAAQTTPAVPESTTPSSSSTPSKATSNGSTWDYIEDQLRRSGKFNDVQIQGIKYNLQRESSLDPTAVGDGGSAFGLGQWHGDRKPSDMSLEGQTQHLINTLSNYDGRLHWIGKDNYEGFMNARTPEEAHYYITRGYERPRKDIVDKVKRYSDMSLRRLNAFGGELGTNGTDWTNGLLQINEGGSHESNPLEGVPMGLDPQGIPNLVEEGETVYNDYVFSDRMKVPFFMYKELGLGGVMKKKGKEMSFADASKKLAQESEQRPNDPISQDGLQASLARLAEVQEAERMKKNAKEYMGLEGYACGGKIGHKYDGKNPFGQQMVTLGMQVPQRGYLSAYKPSTFVAPWNTGFNLDFSRWLPQDTVLPDLDAQMQVYDIKTAEGDKGSKPIIQPRVDTPTGGSNGRYGQGETSGPAAKRELPPLELPTPGSVTFAPKAPTSVTKDDVKGLADNVKKARDDYERRVGEEYDPYPTWMRYAPVWGAGAMALTDMFGLTNKPDYRMAERLEAAAQVAGLAPNIQFKPIGDYMRYEPLDRMFQQNQLNAIARAADRTIVNSSLPTASKYAALLAANYNNQIAAGNLFRQEQEYNRAQYERKKEYDRKTNMFNSQMDLEAAMANARYRQQAQSLGLSGLAQAAALRDSIDARTGAAKAANLSNFFTSFGNIGRENFALNQINSDRSRQYGVYRNGVSEHKRSSKGKKGSRWSNG